ncbi:unnamed protein product, partial [Adineta steineri]
MLTLLPNLYRFYAPEWPIEAEAISTSTIQVLTLANYNPTSIYRTSSVTSLKIHYCIVSDLLSILNYTSMLKYIKIDCFGGNKEQYDYNMDYKSDF